MYTSYIFFFTLLTRPPPRSTLFPYTTLFRSIDYAAAGPTSTTNSPLRFRFRAISRSSADVPRRNSSNFFVNSRARSEEHTSELQSQSNLVCRLLLEKKKNNITENQTIY